MSSRDKKFTVYSLQCAIALLLTVNCTLLTACGFTPLYADRGEKQAGVSRFDDIAIANIPDRSGQYLRNALMDRLYSAGRPSSPRYTLSIDPIAENKSNLDITRSSSATRSQLRLTTKMTLTDTSSGTAVLKRDLVAVDSYNILDSQFTTRISEQSARQNGLDTLARLIEAQLALYFNRP